MVERLTAANPEYISANTNMDGLQARLLLADKKFLNPAHEVTEQDLTNIPSFAQRDYESAENVSLTSREQFWATQQENTFDDQYARWSTTLVKSFANDIGRKRLEKLSPLFQKIGVLAGGEENTFTASHAKKVYDRYFGTDDPERLKKFIGDVLETYQGNEQEITSLLPQIQWFANNFGKEREDLDMTMAYMIGEYKIKLDPSFIENLPKQNEKLRPNELSEREKAVLKKMVSAQVTPLETPSQQENQEEEEDEEEKKENPESYKELIMWKYKDQIQEMIRNNPRSILIGGTGTGKTKETPKFIRELLKPGEMLVVTEPTQINVESLAKKVAEEEGVAQVVTDPVTNKKETILGKEIGFQHGGARNLHDENDTRFMTEGTLLRQLKADKRIPNVRYLMIDEVHIQSKLTEQLIERALEAQRLRQQDVDNGVAGATPLTILFTSATVDKAKLERKCKAGQVLDVPAAKRKYEITPYYETRDLSDDQKAERAAEIIEEYLKKGMKGDFAQAVASIKDIDKYAKAIQKRGLDVEIHKVHSNSTDEAKAEVSRKRGKKEKQRVMIGTGFIQTGVTMPNLEVIINSGDQIAMELDPKTGLIYPKRVKQTQAEIKQWAGRVGRVGPGDVRNLFTQADEAARPEYPQPEMTRSDLTDLVLQVKAQKEKDIFDYDFLSAPLSPERIKFANETLNLLGALNTDGSLNAIGERMAEIPADFHSARMLVAAEQNGKGVEQICTMAAMSENSSSLFADKLKVLNSFGHLQSDFLTYLAIWRGYEKNSNEAEKKKWCEDVGIVYPAMLKIEKNRERLLSGAKNKNAPQASEDELGQFIAAGFNDKQMQYDPTKSTAKRSAYKWLRGHANDVIVYIDRDSSLPTSSMHQYLVTASNGEIREDETTKEKRVYISNCQVVDPSWLSTPLPLVA